MVAINKQCSHQRLHIISQEAWKKISQQLTSDYGHSILISWVLKRTLGFGVRYHSYWETTGSGENKKYVRRVSEVHLDFQDQASKTFFLMKYQ
jgi:hypothetical protein